MRLLVEFVFFDLLAEGVAVDAEVLRRSRQVAAVLLEHAGDEARLERARGLGEADPLVDHLDDECFQLLLHETSSPCAPGRAARVRPTPSGLLPGGGRTPPRTSARCGRRLQAGA